MPKRFISAFMLLCLLFSLCSCVKPDPPEPTEPLPEEAMLDSNYGCCRITNAEGQKIALAIDHEQTDMEIFDRQIIGEELAGWRWYVPYSESFTLVAPEADPERMYEFGVTAGNYFGATDGCGIQEATIDRTGKVSVTGESMELRISISNRTKLGGIITISGAAQEQAVAEPCEKGAVLSGIAGDGKVSIYGGAHECETPYTFTGKPVEIDVVSSPGEILVTPIEDSKQ